jgi:hypothetical protein
MKVTFKTIEAIAKTSNRDLITLANLARKLQAKAFRANEAETIIYACDLKVACEMEMRTRKVGA